MSTHTPHIAENRRARFEYHIDEAYEAGLVLEGWEVKAIRAGQVQLTDGYVLIRDGDRVEAYRALRCDPKEARRLRYRQSPAPARRPKRTDQG